MEIIKKNKKLFLKTILFISLLLFGFVFALSNIANDNVNRQEHRKVISEEIQKNKHEAWQGTAVPNTGYVENVYFNYNLRIEQVVEILDAIDFITFDSEAAYGVYYVIFYEDEINYAIEIMRAYNEEIDRISVITGSNTDVAFQSKLIDGDNNSVLGWNETYANNDIKLPVGVEVISSADGISVGNQNEKLSSLFSITPFVEVKEATIIEIIGNGIADAAGNFGEVLTFGFEAVKKVIFNEDNTLTYTGSVVVILVSTAAISLAFRLLLKAFGFIRVG